MGKCVNQFGSDNGPLMCLSTASSLMNHDVVTLHLDGIERNKTQLPPSVDLSLPKI